ncbi:MAG: M28 family peptidase [Planctomycetota bacterium]|nr:M28 family peptidase [Planctomycetota bacterium]
MRFTRRLDAFLLCLALAGALVSCRYAPDRTSDTVTPRKGHDEFWPALDPSAVSVQKLADHLQALADGRMMGRSPLASEVSTSDEAVRHPAEIPPATQYIADIFCRLHLATLQSPLGSAGGGPRATEPASSEGIASFLRPFRISLRSLGDRNRLAIVLTGQMGKKTVDLKLTEDFLPIGFSAPGAVSAPLFFAGYGITALELNYDDYRGHDVKGKLVLVLEGSPGPDRAGAPNDPSGESGPNTGVDPLYSSVIYKTMNAKRHGAVGLLLVPSVPPPSEPERLAELGVWPSCLPSRMKKRLESKPPNGPGTFLESLVLAAQAPAGKFTEEELLRHTDALGKREVFEVEDEANTILSAALTSAAADAVLGFAGSSVEKARDEIELNQRPCSFEMPGVCALLECTAATRDWRGINIVAAVLPECEIKDAEWVIVGAHYDSLGLSADGRAFPGANDNGSGSTVLLELARCLAPFKGKVKRGVLLCSFDGEESGLLGARRLVRELAPVAASVVAMINIDMVGGRCGPGAQSAAAEGTGPAAVPLQIIGAVRSPELCAIFKKHIEPFGVEVRSDVEFAFMLGGDHWPFHLAKVPSIQLTTSRFPEMHTLDDTVDKVDVESLERLSKGILQAVLELANGSERFPAPRYAKTEYPNRK